MSIKLLDVRTVAREHQVEISSGVSETQKQNKSIFGVMQLHNFAISFTVSLAFFIWVGVIVIPICPLAVDLVGVATGMWKHRLD